MIQYCNMACNWVAKMIEVYITARWVLFVQVFAFSAENWRRRMTEISFLLSLTEKVMQQELHHLKKEGVVLHFIGSRDSLPASLQSLINR